jgi:hypothetical protein
MSHSVTHIDRLQRSFKAIAQGAAGTDAQFFPRPALVHWLQLISSFNITVFQLVRE